MDGFKDTFSHLYEDTNYYFNRSFTLQVNTSSEDGYNGTRGCSAGNGADSDGVIVSLYFVTIIIVMESCL